MRQDYLGTCNYSLRLDPGLRGDASMTLNGDLVATTRSLRAGPVTASSGEGPSRIVSNPATDLSDPTYHTDFFYWSRLGRRWLLGQIGDLGNFAFGFFSSFENLLPTAWKCPDI